MLRIDGPDFVVTAEQISTAVNDLALSIRRKYPNGCTICAVLQGAKQFALAIEDALSDRKHLYPVCFIGARRYQADAPEATTTLYGTAPSMHLFKKRNVVLLEDVIDKGETAKAVGQYLVQTGFPSEIRVMALCVKGEKPEWVAESDVGFQLPADGFIIGYGMDYNGHYRDLDVIRPITEEEKQAAAEQTDEDLEIDLSLLRRRFPEATKHILKQRAIEIKAHREKEEREKKEKEEQGGGKKEEPPVDPGSKDTTDGSSEGQGKGKKG